MSKQKIREQIKRRLQELSERERREKSDAIAGRIFSMNAWRECDHLLIYSGMAKEVDTRPIITAALERGRRVFLPRVNGDDLDFHEITDAAHASVPHPYGMLEPSPILPALPGRLPTDARILVITPGLAFDRRKNRLGRGGGYYDRFLKRLPGSHNREQDFLLGVCFHLQLCESVPASADDVRMDAVVTEEEIIL